MTAVEWFIEQVKSKEWQDMFIWHKEEVFEQAKAMEKEQIIETSKNSYISGYLDNQCKVDESMNFPEEYYNETYNNESNNL